MAALLAMAALGLAIIAVPDTGARVVTFSATHGPSALDTVGVVLLLAGWAPVPVVLVRRRRLIPVSTWAWAGAAGVAAAAALATAIRSDLPWWWAPGGVLLAVQIALLRVAVTRSRSAIPIR